MTAEELAKQIRVVLGDHDDADLPVVNLINRLIVELNRRKEHDDGCICFCYEANAYVED